MPDVKSGSENIKSKRDAVAPQGVYSPVGETKTKQVNIEANKIQIVLFPRIKE